MKSGFTLIELTIGLLLSGIIATALYNAFFVTHRVVDVTDTIIKTDFRSALLENQFQKDLEGVFIPEQDQTTTLTTTKAPAIKEEKKSSASEPKKEAQKPQPPLEKIFYSINGAGDALSVLTFITNNPVKVYQKANNVKPKSRIVRVVYRLIPQEDNPKKLSLVRQESSDLDFKNYDLKSSKAIRGYELVSGIKNIKATFTFPLQKNEKEPTKNPKPPVKSAAEKKDETPKPEYRTVSQWDVETKKDEPQEQPKIPQFITIACELWDTQEQREYTVTFNYEIPTFLANIMPKKQKKSAPLKEENKEEKKAEPTPTPPEQKAPESSAEKKPISALELLKGKL